MRSCLGDLQARSLDHRPLRASEQRTRESSTLFLIPSSTQDTAYCWTYTQRFGSDVLRQQCKQRTSCGSRTNVRTWPFEIAVVSVGRQVGCTHVTEPSADPALCLDLFEDDIHRARVQRNEQGEFTLV